MRRPLVIGNWKMHGSRASASALCDQLRNAFPAEMVTEIAVCPSFVFLADVADKLAESAVAYGAQNVSDCEQGAHTGEVAADMLNDFGCRYVIVGHSERRALYGEDDVLVANKCLAVQQQNMIPVLCVGETLEERDSGKALAVIERQLSTVLEKLDVSDLNCLVIAYEPVWAIGTGQTATPQQAQDVHAFIRGLVAKKEEKIADSLRILYGGSVKGANAAELFEQNDIDGGLVGGASLDSQEFAVICQAAG